MIIQNTCKPLFKKVTSIPTGTDVWTGNNLSVRAEIGIFAPAMKILFVINNFYIPGNGISASARRTVAALKQIGEDVRILAGPNPDPDGPQPDFPLEEYIFPFFQPIIESSGFSYASGDMKMIEKAVRWADVVHLEETFVLQWKTIKVAKKLGKPITATFHMFPENLIYSLGIGPLRNWKWLNRTLFKAWRKHIYNACDYIQCPTQMVMDRLRRYHFKSRLSVISNGIVPDTCTRPQLPPEDYLAPERPFEVLYVGRLSHEKDQPTLMEAMRYSKYAGRIRLHFAGNGPQNKRYRKKAKKMFAQGVFGYEPVFTFNNREELRQLAAKADLCPHCAPIEVEGLSIMEAMQQGACPVIAVSPYSGTSQFAQDSRCTFPAQEPKALAQRIDYWLDHPQERWEMGLKHAQAMEQYDIRLSAIQLRDALAETLKSR